MIFWAMIALFVIVTLIFVIITLLFPEWVGITGKVALEYQRQQRGDPPPEAPSEVQNSLPDPDSKT